MRRTTCGVANTMRMTLLLALGPATSKQVGDHLGISTRNAHDLMRRAHDAGMVGKQWTKYGRHVAAVWVLGGKDEPRPAREKQSVIGLRSREKRARGPLEAFLYGRAA